MTRRFARSLLLALFVGAVPSSSAPLEAQAGPATPGAARLEGQVVRVGEPLAGVPVVLHRIARDQAGEIDTVAAGPRGDFRFSLPSVPTPEAEGDVYFASVRYQGILYFGAAVSRPEQLDSLYAIEVFDTTEAPPEGAALPVAVRYLVAEPAGPDGAGWRVTDLFEVANEGDRTLVAASDSGVTWAHPLPSGIAQIQVGGGDLSPDAARTVDGRLELSGPIPPGQRQFILRYEVPDLAAFEVPLAAGTREVEMLLAEPSPAEEVVGLSAVETIEVQPGLSFRRYTGQFEQGGVLRLVLTEPPGEWPLRQLVVVLGLLLAVVGLWAALRTSASPGGSPAGGESVGTSAPSMPGAAGSSGSAEPAGESRMDRRRLLLLEIARIDEALEALESVEAGAPQPDAAHVQALRERRSELLHQVQQLG
jgi:hypothetical protein